MDGKLGLLAWRWLFIIEGAITVVIAIFAFFILPDFPKSTTWLTPIEKDMAMWRLEVEVGTEDWAGGKNEKLTHGLKLAFSDPKTYVLMVIITCVVHSGSVTNFFPTYPPSLTPSFCSETNPPSVVGTLGYNRIISLLLTCPPYALAVLTTFANSIHARHTT